MPTMGSRAIQAHRRALIQAAKFAIRDVFDAIVELVTNADDRYQILDREGLIEIEIEHKRGKNPSILKVRDHADGMDADTMDKKLSILGGRESGMEAGAMVRGTHSRGAKDVAALGNVVFESIASDMKYHKCEITPFFDFVPFESQKLTPEIRRSIGILEGTGTLVTIHLEKTQRIPLYENLKKQIEHLVSLRGILGDKRRKLVLRDKSHKDGEILSAPHINGKDRLKESLDIPSYPQARAKLIICRAGDPFEREPERFRLGGIRIESKRAIHQATLFDPGLETDNHALWFFGRLICPYIDDLCIQFDERFEARLPPEELNPTYPLDPSRRSGLNREHPFVRALYAEALIRLRPLVEEERKREEHERARIESNETRKRLNALEKAAIEFMQSFDDVDQTARDQDGKSPDSSFMEKGYSLSPPYIQMIVGQSQVFWLNVRQDTFPELDTSSTVQIECLSNELVSDKRYCGLEPHPVRQGVLRALWKVKAISATPTTGIKVRVGPIIAESIIEVLSSEAEKYSHITKLEFSRKHYNISTEKSRKKIRILAPISLVEKPTSVCIEIDSQEFEISGQQVLSPNERLCVSLCDLTVKSTGKEASARITAKLDNVQATADIASIEPMGADLSIRLEDIDLGNQRYRWRQNVLEIAARHPSLRRYLGDKQAGFPGQESKHFRVLIAEVVADAVCSLVVRRSVQNSPEDFEDADWDAYYSLYSKYLTEFLPLAHKLQCPEA